MALKLNAAFTKAATDLKKLGRIGPEMPKWQWDDTREMMWRVLRNEVLPELGIGDPKTDEEKRDLAVARAQFNKAFDEGYCVESSNLGKHLADNDFAPKEGAKSAAKAEYA